MGVQGHERTSWAETFASCFERLPPVPTDALPIIRAQVHTSLTQNPLPPQDRQETPRHTNVSLGLGFGGLEQKGKSSKRKTRLGGEVWGEAHHTCPRLLCLPSHCTGNVDALVQQHVRKLSHYHRGRDPSRGGLHASSIDSHSGSSSLPARIQHPRRSYYHHTYMPSIVTHS
jgi:hypothetical protein